MSYVMTAAGERELKRILTKYGREHDNFTAWVTDVDNQLGNRYEGESLEVELTGLREATGQTVFVSFDVGDVELLVIDELCPFESLIVRPGQQPAGCEDDE